MIKPPPTLISVIIQTSVYTRVHFRSAATKNFRSAQVNVLCTTYMAVVELEAGSENRYDKNGLTRLF